MHLESLNHLSTLVNLLAKLRKEKNNQDIKQKHGKKFLVNIPHIWILVALYIMVWSLPSLNNTTKLRVHVSLYVLFFNCTVTFSVPSKLAFSRSPNRISRYGVSFKWSGLYVLENKAFFLGPISSVKKISGVALDFFILHVKLTDLLSSILIDSCPASRDCPWA